MKTLTLKPACALRASADKPRTTYVLPTKDRSATAATAITLRQPLDREAQLRADLSAEVQRTKAELAATKARLAEIEQAAAAQAEAQRAKEAAVQAEMERIGRETVARAAREKRVRAAPGFREVDNIAAFYRRAAEFTRPRHRTTVTITGKTIAVTDHA